jgi:DNA-directed RNA polymerase specialized sigma24 family protein
VLVHACFDEARRLRRHGVDVARRPLALPSIVDDVSAVEDRDRLERGFLRLQPELRAVIVLHHYLDQPLPVVAATLGIPLGTAKSRLHRALNEMRAALDADSRVRGDLAEGRPA